MQKNRWMMIGAVAVAVLLIAYLVASPWIMLARFKADAQARKTERMEIYVDFAAVRASIKTQLLARFAGSMQGRTNEGVAAIGMAFANAVIDPLVQVVASPEGVVAMMNGENPLPGFNRLGIAVPEQAGIRQPQAQPLERFAAGQMLPVAQGPAAAAPAPSAPRKQWRLAYDGPNRAVIRSVPEQAGDPYLVMHRRNVFTWKVTDVQLGRIF